MFHLRFGLSDHLKALLDFVFGSRRRVKKVRIFRAWFSQWSENDPTMKPSVRKPPPRNQGYFLRPPRACCILRSGYHSKFHRILNTAPATKSDTWTSPNTAPATKNDTWTSPNAAPATKRSTWTSPNAAPATKSDTSPSPIYYDLTLT